MYVSVQWFCIPVTASAVAKGNSVLKPIKRRGNEGTLNLGGSCRLCAINYVALSNTPHQNSGKLYVAASRTKSITVSVFAIKHILYK